MSCKAANDLRYNTRAEPSAGAGMSIQEAAVLERQTAIASRIVLCTHRKGAVLVRAHGRLYVDAFRLNINTCSHAQKPSVACLACLPCSILAD